MNILTVTEVLKLSPKELNTLKPVIYIHGTMLVYNRSTLKTVYFYKQIGMNIKEIGISRNGI
jgi:hypothetical protein